MEYLLEEEEDGQLYHAKSEAGVVKWLLDERGEKIPASVCLCFAYTPSECACATTAWVNYRWDNDY